jgi:hypothetical protein
LKLSQNRNLSSNIFPQTGFSQFLSLAFKSCAASKEKYHSFQKKAKKSKIQNFVQIEKKYFGKNSFTKFLYPLEKSMFSQIRVTGRLVDSYSYEKPLLIDQKLHAEYGPILGYTF